MGRIIDGQAGPRSENRICHAEVVSNQWHEKNGYRTQYSIGGNGKGEIFITGFNDRHYGGNGTAATNSSTCGDQCG